MLDVPSMKGLAVTVEYIPNFVQLNSAQRELLDRLRLGLETGSQVELNCSLVAGDDPQAHRLVALGEHTFLCGEPQHSADASRPGRRSEVDCPDLRAMRRSTFIPIGTKGDEPCDSPRTTSNAHLRLARRK